MVTGGTGFIGRHLVSRLREMGWSVVSVTRRKVTASDPGITCVYGDLSQPETLEYSREEVGPIDAVFHLAARMPTSRDIEETYDYLHDNVLGTTRLLLTFLRLEAAVFVYTSSISVIGQPLHSPVTEQHPTYPTHPYSVSKLSAELVCEQIRRSEHRSIASLRLTSPYGPGMPTNTVLPRFVQMAQASQDITLYGTGARTQNFLHVSDAVHACILSAQHHVSGIFNVGGPRDTSMKSLAELIVKLIPGSRIAYPGIPDPQEDHRWAVDSRKAQQAFDYTPAVTLEAGLKDYLDRRDDAPRWWHDE